VLKKKGKLVLNVVTAEGTNVEAAEFNNFVNQWNKEYGARSSAQLNAVPAPNGGAKYVFDAATGRYRDATTGRFVAARELPWPPNGGFASSARETVQPGTILDRYGSPTGRFFGEPGATVSQRGMAPGAEAMPYTRYRVLKPFDTQAGPAAGVPEFGAAGGSKQYLAGNNVQWLLDNGFIEVVK
jgi:Tuberculosis necrotizing toxin